MDLLVILLDFALLRVHVLQVARERDMEVELGAGAGPSKPWDSAWRASCFTYFGVNQ
jgi:hypothetical protein